MKLASRNVLLAVGLALSHSEAKARPEMTAAQQQRAAADALFTNGVILHLQIEIPSAGVESLRRDPRKYVEATVREGATVHSHVLIHLKGSIGSFRKVDDKPGLTLNLRSASDTFHGLRKFHLNNTVQDNTYLSEWVCSDLFRAAQVPATRAAHALVDFNGRKLGLYVLVESVNRDFLARYFRNPHGNVYGQSGNGDVTDPLERMEGRGENTRTDLKTLAEAVQERDTARLWERLQAVLDVDEFIAFMAMEVMLCHWDGYTLAAHNFRICQNLETGKMVFVPHDLDQMIGDPNLPIHPGANGLVAQAILKAPAGRTLYQQRFGTLFTNVFTVPTLHQRIDWLVARLLPTLAAYEPVLAREVQNNVQGLKDRIADRARGLEQQLTFGVPANLVLEGKVTDADTLKPIARFMIVPGFRRGEEAVEWDRTHFYGGQGGSFTVDLANARLPRSPAFLRFEAEGYQPVVVRYTLSTNAHHAFYDIALKKGNRLTGLVRLPDGTPATGAQAAVLTASSSPVLRRGAFVPKPGLPILQLRDRGRYSFASDPEALALVAVHPAGFAETPLDDSLTQPTLTLQPWGRIEGTVVGGESPSMTGVAMLTAQLRIPHLLNGMYAGVLNLDPIAYTVPLPGNGPFAIDQVPPGERYLWRSVSIDGSTNASPSNLSFVGRRLLIQPGETNRPAWGATEQSLVGQIVVKDHLPDTEALDPVETMTLFKLGCLELTLAGAAAPAPEQLFFTLGEEDRFRVSGLRSGNYQAEWRVFAPPRWLGVARQHLVIPAASAPSGCRVLDAGTIELATIPLAKVGQPAPPIDLKAFDGARLRLADFRGTCVLIHFWAAWCRAQPATVPCLKAIWDQYHDDPRLTLIGLSLDQDPETAQRYVNRHGLKWRQGYLGQWFQSSLPAEYGVAALPSAVIIGPAGEIFAKNVPFGHLAQAIKDALTNAKAVRR